MDSFHLLLKFSIYRTLFIAYVSIKVHKILSFTHHDGTHRQVYRLRRTQAHQEDRRNLRDCETKREVHCFFRDCDET